MVFNLNKKINYQIRSKFHFNEKLKVISNYLKKESCLEPVLLPNIFIP